MVGWNLLNNHPAYFADHWFAGTYRPIEDWYSSDPDLSSDEVRYGEAHRPLSRPGKDGKYGLTVLNCAVSLNCKMKQAQSSQQFYYAITWKEMLIDVEMATSLVKRANANLLRGPIKADNKHYHNLRWYTSCITNLYDIDTSWGSK